MLSNAKKPLFWFGHGIRLAGAVNLIEPFLERFNIPFVTSWQGKDMVRHDHPRFMGHAGIYGHRAANTAVQNADLIVAIGTRLALPQTGYDLSKFAPNARLVVVDIDMDEAKKDRTDMAIVSDAKAFMQMFYQDEQPYVSHHWNIKCLTIQTAMPWLEKCHDDTEYINSYRFCWELNKWLKPDQVIITDMGTALLSAYPMLKLNGKQRLITSTGLGEMGFGLPAAIGASLGAASEVLCLNCDGGLMFNLQELATLKHYRLEQTPTGHRKLPIKIILFENGGYSMIKRSQEGMGMALTASGTKDLSFPDWRKLAYAFDLQYGYIKTWDDFNRVIPKMQNANCPYLAEVAIDPDQKFGPKVPTLKDENGHVFSPALTEMV